MRLSACEEPQQKAEPRKRGWLLLWKMPPQHRWHAGRSRWTAGKWRTNSCCYSRCGPNTRWLLPPLPQPSWKPPSPARVCFEIKLKSYLVLYIICPLSNFGPKNFNYFDLVSILKKISQKFENNAYVTQLFNFGPITCPLSNFDHNLNSPEI